jgi:hypothetical protein
VAVFSAAAKFVTGDEWTVAFTNTISAAQKLFERFFGMRAMGLQLPSNAAGGETISDSVVA